MTIRAFSFMVVPLSLLLSFAAPASGDEFAPDSIISIIKRVAEYHMKYGYNNYPNSWDGGAYMTGIMAMHRLTGDAKYLDFARQWAIKFKWMPCVNILTTSADDICCFQTYCEIFLRDPKPANDSMIANVRTNLYYLFDSLRTNPPHVDPWTWDDALYMAPAAVSRYCTASKSNRFLDSLNRYWWTTSADLYDTNYHLWYRDGGYKSQKAANGQPVFWSCGVAWVMGGITRVLQDMPLNYSQRPQWEKQFREMAAAIKAEQGNNALYGGLWTTSMRDHNQFPDPESSASAFFCFGLTWGINNRLLDSAQYIECVKNVWHDLVANVGADGRLRRCQKVSLQPDIIDPNNSSVEGEAAFMLAGEEMWKMATGATATAENRMQPSSAGRVSPRSFVIVGNRFVGLAVPLHAASISIYDVAGKRLWFHDIRAGFSITLPAYCTKNSVYIVRYLDRKD
jgi:unsaturated rhamnogalacturonyl hydrolase